MAVAFWWADEVQAIARPLIEKYHPHLTHCSPTELRYMFRSEGARKNGKIKLGSASKIGGRTSFLADPCAPTVEEEADLPEPFFLIEIAHDQWMNLSDSQRLALVDHELTHCRIEMSSEGTPVKLIAPHDVEEFASIIEKHGLWKQDVKEFVNRAARATQESLFDLETGEVKEWAPPFPEVPSQPDVDLDEELYEKAKDMVVRSGLGSVSMLQRKMKIGFARAGRIMDLLEKGGVVGPPNGSSARAVLMTVDELDAEQAPVSNVVQLRPGSKEELRDEKLAVAASGDGDGGSDAEDEYRRADPGAQAPSTKIPHALSPHQDESCAADVDGLYDHRDCEEAAAWADTRPDPPPSKEQDDAK